MSFVTKVVSVVESGVVLVVSVDEVSLMVSADVKSVLEELVSEVVFSLRPHPVSKRSMVDKSTVH